SDVSLSGTLISDPGLKELSKIPNLRHLELSPSSISGIGFKYFKDSDRLEYLVLGDAVSTDGLDFVGKIKSLRTLGLDYGSVSDEGLSKLTNLTKLQRLTRRKNRGVTDAGLDHLRSLPSLEYLDLSATRVTSVGEKGVIQGCFHESNERVYVYDSAGQVTS